ncbi:hypothetical protein A9Q86_11195 [Flavobacteriales bacterium 33_180_T64]|nr:hypothetical protein A9Q86_11195 [Flavobacteriales bacterium 33_180_T64]
MKNIIKISSLILVFACFFACDDNDDLGFQPTENVGWIQFPGSNPAVIEINTETQPTFNVGIDIQVPIVAQDLTISYTLVPVSGLNPNTIFSNSGTILSPAGESSYAGPDNNTGSNYDYLANIEFNTSEIPFITELMIFDVVLTATNDANITVGLEGADKPTVQRVSILCANPDSIPADYFIGDYAIADLVGTIGPGNGTENFAAGTVTLTVDPFNPNARIFSSAILPAFNAEIESISIVFTENDVISLGDVDPGLACGATAPPYVYTDGGATNSLWSICNSDDFLIVNYTEDPNGSCGGPFDASFTLTKL